MEKILYISPSTLDRKSLLLTLIVCVFPALFFGYISFATDNAAVRVFWGCMIALFAGVFIFGILCTPHKYILTNSHLIIKR
jgi:hypothetical protein